MVLTLRILSKNTIQISITNDARSNSWSNSIVWNTLVGNGAYGIELSDSSVNNVIHHNDFLANGQNTSQACDNGMNNQWYDETVLEGNYWITMELAVILSMGQQEREIPLPRSLPIDIGFRKQRLKA